MTALADLCSPDIERMRIVRDLRRTICVARAENRETFTVNGGMWPLSALEAVLAWVEDGYQPDREPWLEELCDALGLTAPDEGA